MVTKSLEHLAYEKGIFRYGIISELFSRPPRPGEMASRLREIANKTYTQPWDKKDVQFSVRTLERWYFLTQKSGKPAEELQPKLRSDRGSTRVISSEQKAWLCSWRTKYVFWSIQLLYDNFTIKFLNQFLPSYSTVLRFFKMQGFVSTYSFKNKKKKLKEVRTFEVEFVGQLWHMDFHKCSRTIYTEKGEIMHPICMAIIDDKSRLVCHAQWFLNETAEVLVHGFIQAMMKRGLPRTFYSDNGSAMKAEEFVEGLSHLSISQEKTLPYSPYQNGKQEAFWQPLENRLMKMLPKEKRITLDILNKVTIAWIEEDYHVKIHSETGQTPMDRFLNEKNVLRDFLDFNTLKKSFRKTITRSVRKTDGTLTIDGIRFQIPQQYAFMESLTLRYARWDLGEAEIVCPQTKKDVCTIFPIDKISNSNAIRKERDSKNSVKTEHSFDLEEDFLDLNTDHLVPLLAHCLTEYSKKNIHNGYLNMREGL